MNTINYFFVAFIGYLPGGEYTGCTTIKTDQCFISCNDVLFLLKKHDIRYNKAIITSITAINSQQHEYFNRV